MANRASSKSSLRNSARSLNVCSRRASRGRLTHWWVPDENGCAHMHLFRVVLFLAAILAALLLPACSPDTPYPAVTYNLGERVDLGHLVYLVFDTQWLTHIG